MFRTFVCAAVALVLFAGAGFCADKAKKGQGAKGTIKKVDAATGTLTVTVKTKNGDQDKQFKVEDATKIVVFEGKDKKELTGKAGLSAGNVKEGTPVTIAADENGKVTAIQIGAAKKKAKK